MELSVILTAVGTVVAIVGSNIALIGWLRGDMKLFETKIDGWKEQFSRDMASYKEEVNKESKDFHGRLCSLEARYHEANYKPRTDP